MQVISADVCEAFTSLVLDSENKRGSQKFSCAVNIRALATRASYTECL